MKSQFVASIAGSFAVLVFAIALASYPSAAKTKAPAPSIDIPHVQIASGVDVPKDYIDALEQKLTEELDKTKAFTAVRQEGQGASSSDLQLTWTITRFDPGSRKKRVSATGYGRLFGVGATKMQIHAQLRNPVNNAILLDRDVEGAEKGNTMNPVNFHAAFRDSKNVVNVEARKLADELKKAAHNYSEKN
ncbi:MAG TPA: DUF4410 domain-containing protein [Terriglobales bacterium]|nr:DUF4410 domain-containing protein [Terriglobales bacterium]